MSGRLTFLNHCMMAGRLRMSARTVQSTERLRLEVYFHPLLYGCHKNKGAEKLLNKLWKRKG